MKLPRGQSLRLAVTASLGNAIAVGLSRWDKRGLGRPLAWSLPGGGEPLAYRAAKGGTFLLILIAIDDGSHSFTLTCDVLPPGVDVVPPHVRALGAPEAWTSHAATVRCAATDGPAGSGLMGIDTIGPTPQAWRPEHPVTRGQPIPVTFAADDASGCVWCQLLVRSAATGETVLTRTLGWRPTPQSGFIDDRTAFVATIDRKLPRGTYDVLVAGRTHDRAGSLCVDAACERQLVVL
jgi:hypothetical protein